MAKQSISRIWKHPITLGGLSVVAAFKRMLTDEFIAWEQHYFDYAQGRAGTKTELEGKDAIDYANQLAQWIKDSLRDYVSIEPDELEIDGVAVTTGAQVYDYFGSDLKEMIGVMNAIWAYHRFEDEARKKLLSPSGSGTTSDVPAREAAGPTPEPTVPSAESEGSAQTADAAPAAPSTSSGETPA